MGDPVTFEISPLVKRSPADLTTIRLLSSMNKDMRFQLSSRWEGFLAEAAGEVFHRFLSAHGT